MAVMIPDSPQSFNNSEGEYQVFNALKQLDNSCYVFYSLSWINIGTSRVRKAQGEADFVIFDTQRGVLVIEVKAGEIQFVNGQLYQKNRATGKQNATDPENQARATKFLLLEKIENALNSVERCLVCHAVWFPSVKYPKYNLPPSYPTEIVLDENSLNDSSNAVVKVYEFWASKFPAHKLSKTSVEKVLQAIAPSFCVIPSLRSSFEFRDKQFIQMTAEQAKIIDFLDEQNTAVIGGTAGTGKTVLGLEKARRLSADGEQVLFLCYNAALKKFLNFNHSQPGIQFHTIHSLARECSPFVNCSLDQLPSVLIDYLAQDESYWKYDHIIVDEGQDFDDDLLEWLSLRTSGSFYIFFDRNQLIYRDTLPTWIETAECRLVLKRNCRNTLQIAKTAQRCAGFNKGQETDGVQGPKPKLYACKDETEVKSHVKALIKTFREGGLKPHEIAILSMETIEKSVLQNIEQLKLGQLSEDFEEGKITFTTVRKFKGLEAKALILVDVYPQQFAKAEWRRRIYVGCSRAVHELHILLENSTPAALGIATQYLSKSEKALSGDKALAMLLNADWNKGATHAYI